MGLGLRRPEPQAYPAQTLSLGGCPSPPPPHLSGEDAPYPGTRRSAVLASLAGCLGCAAHRAPRLPAPPPYTCVWIPLPCFQPVTLLKHFCQSKQHLLDTTHRDSACTRGVWQGREGQQQEQQDISKLQDERCKANETGGKTEPATPPRNGKKIRSVPLFA